MRRIIRQREMRRIEQAAKDAKIREGEDLANYTIRGNVLWRTLRIKCPGCDGELVYGKRGKPGNAFCIRHCAAGHRQMHLSIYRHAKALLVRAYIKGESTDGLPAHFFVEDNPKWMQRRQAPPLSLAL